MPRKTAARTARLASIPLGVAGRAVGGWGKRLVGQNADQVSAELSAKTAEQLFAVLGTLKGGAMKFGQTLSLFEAVLPEDMAKPYREHLTRLQDSAPPMSTAVVHQQLTREFTAGWKRSIVEFDDPPVLHGLIMSKKALPPAQQAAWRGIVEQMRADGTVQRIFEKYFKPELARTMTQL